MSTALTTAEKDSIDNNSQLLKGLFGTTAGFGTLLANQLGKAKIAFGTASFVTTGLTLDITASTQDGVALSSVSAVIITPSTDNAAYKASASGGVVTVTRPSGGTSAASFSYLIIGE